MTGTETDTQTDPVTATVTNAQDKVRRREQRDRRTLCNMAAREDQLKQQAGDAAARMDVHVTNTLKTLQNQHTQQVNWCTRRTRLNSPVPALFDCAGSLPLARLLGCYFTVSDRF